MDIPKLIGITKMWKLLKNHLHPTPMFRSPGFSEMLNLEMIIKNESLQPIRSFKIHGGIYALSLLDNVQRINGMITAST